MTSSAVVKRQCATCEKNTGIFICGGCSQAFCTRHASEHRQVLGKQMDEIILEHDQLWQSINEQNNQCSSMKEIDEWERQSIDQIHRTAENVRQELKQCMIKRTEHVQTVVQKLKEQLNEARIEDDFIETDLKLWSDQIDKLKTDLIANFKFLFTNIEDDLICLVRQHKLDLCWDSHRDVEVQTDDQVSIDTHWKDNPACAQEKVRGNTTSTVVE